MKLNEKFLIGICFVLVFMLAFMIVLNDDIGDISSALSKPKISQAQYMRSLQKKIKAEWKPPARKQKKNVVVSFTIDKNGQLISPKIKTSSGDDEMDEAALIALERAAPFDPLPESILKLTPKNKNSKSVNIEFKFDYNVLEKP